MLLPLLAILRVAFCTNIPALLPTAELKFIVELVTSKVFPSALKNKPEFPVPFVMSTFNLDALVVGVKEVTILSALLTLRDAPPSKSTFLLK